VLHSSTGEKRKRKGKKGKVNKYHNNQGIALSFKIQKKRGKRRFFLSQSSKRKKGEKGISLHHT